MLEQRTKLIVLVLLMTIATMVAAGLAVYMLIVMKAQADLIVAFVSVAMLVIAGLFFAVTTQIVTSIEEGRTRLKAIVKTAADGIITIDERGKVESVNPAGEDMFGYTSDEMQGQSFTSLLSSRYEIDEDGYFEDFMQRNKIEAFGEAQEVVGLRRNGSSLDMDLTVSDTELEDRLMFTVIVRDITERKKAQNVLANAYDALEERVAERTAELEHANKRLEDEIATRVLAQKELASARDGLEVRVAKRTADLEEANERLQDEIAERLKAQEALKQAHDALEERVQERTRDLSEANRCLESEVQDRKKAEEEREALITDLKEALNEINTLGGLIPICASCKKVRDDGGYWNQIETYVREHSGAEFSHGICPDCAKKLYPELKSPRS